MALTCSLLRNKVFFFLKKVPWILISRGRSTYVFTYAGVLSYVGTYIER